nr:lysozyme inhibitor LprI family protein [uncultured Pseudomonas sp.]
MKLISLVVGTTLLALHGPTAIAGMDCRLASTASELAVCANPSLYQLDVRMGALYTRLRKSYPQTLPALQQAQRAWLKQRNSCADEPGCLRSQYSERLVALHRQLRDHLVYQPDDIDQLALEDLRQAVEQARQADAEFPLESVLKSLQIKSATTRFQNVSDDPESFKPATFPRHRPDGVSPDEWRALQKSNIDYDGESGNTSYTLIDLDGDGLRDLVIDTYTGGTGLFSYIRTLRRSADSFVGAMEFDEPSDDDEFSSYLYSLNERGANQEGYWIALRGRVYAAYRVGSYAIDHLYLLPPLAPAGQVPTLTLNYRYDLSIPKVQAAPSEASKAELSEDELAALSQALNLVDTTSANTTGNLDAPLCPVPPGLSDDLKREYYGFGPGHYTYEIVADMPVMLEGHCHIGRLANWFGSYAPKHGLHAQLWVRRPGSSEARDYQVHGLRELVGTTTSLGDVEGDNGF